MKIFSLVMTFFMTGVAGHAQILFPTVGVTASVNTNRPEFYDITSKVGFTMGVGYNHKLTEIASLQVELNYVLKAFESTYEENTTLQVGEDVYGVYEKRSDKYAISYIELPLLLKVSVFHPDFFVTGGPSLAGGLGGSHKYKLDRESSYLGTLHEEATGKIKFSDGSPQNNEDVYFDNRWDIGVHVGIGALLFKKLQIECRYGFGTINLLDHRESKNRYLQFTCSTPIPLRK